MNKHEKNFQKINELLLKYESNSIKDYELLEQLKDIDLLDLFKALYFTTLESENYRKEYNKMRNQNTSKSMIEFYENLKHKMRNQ